jgi:hypothetical protein
MHEIEPALAQRDTETNYGSAGNLADAYYGDWQVLAAGNPQVVNHQQPGALANDADASVYFTGANGSPSGGSYAIVPRTSPLTTIKAPFSLEAWVKPYNNVFGIILSVGSQTANSGLNGSANEAGFDWIWAGTASTFSITMRNGSGTSQTEPKTTANYNPGNWYHLVTTYDGTNVAYYVNGVQDSLQTSSAAGFSPNTWMPLTIGGGRWTGTIANQFQGSIDELAVYTNVLQVLDIQAHYNAGVSGASGAYKSGVLADNPLLYYRMDSPTYTPPPVSAWPALTNYGSSGVQGFYKPNAIPGGVAGPNVAGVPAKGFPNSALAGDGNSIFADAGFDTTFNPVGQTPMSVTAIFRANPADVQQRNWQTLVGHTDQNWRCAINGGTGAVGFDSGNGLDVRSTNTYNDALWHQVVGTYDDSNTLVYVDGALAGSGFKNSGQSTAGGAPAFDIYLASSPNGQSNAAGGHSFAGSMCEAAFFNGKVLTPAQVAMFYSNVDWPPSIIQQPIAVTANELSAFTNLYVLANGTSPLFYQWFRNGSPVSGQTSFDLFLNPAQSSDAGTYTVVVTNAYGSVTSAPAILTVATVPRIVQDVASTSVNLLAGGHATFAITATGALPLRYQWFSNNVALGGATNTSFNLANAQVGGPYSYVCTVTNALGATNSSTVVVTLIPITAPYSQTILSDHPVGYWRLDECPDDGNGNTGVIASDYWGGNNGAYTNTYTCQTPGYSVNTDPGEATPYFGIFSLSDSLVGGIQNVDFGTPVNASATFSVEAWINGSQQSQYAGIVCKGYSAAEQFNLNCGASGGGLQFQVRDAAGVNYLANGPVFNGSSFGTWHHMVGVCDEIRAFP